jgi:hypothetical protein
VDDTLWVRFLGDAGASDQRPKLVVHRADGSVEELFLKPRTRDVLAVLAAPRRLAGAYDDPADFTPGLTTWRARDLKKKAHVTPPTLKRAMDEIRSRLAEVELDPRKYLRTERRGNISAYSLDNVRVDVVELLVARDDPARIDTILRQVTDEPANLWLTDRNNALFGPRTRQELQALLAEAAARRARRGRGTTATDPRYEIINNSASRASLNRNGNGAAPRRWVPVAEGQASSTLRRSITFLGVLLAVLGISAALVPRHHHAVAPPTRPVPRTYPETVGGPANTWSNPQTGGGSHGPTISSNQTVQISCRLQGFKVQDGDTWWYRIASAPWDNKYYVSADAFYNNGQTSGTLKGTPFFDPRVPTCR